MKELINEIKEKISHFESNNTEKQAIKTIYQIKELIIKSQIDLQKIRESGLWIKYFTILMKFANK